MGCSWLASSDRPCSTFQSCPPASEGYPGGLTCLTNLLWLLCWSWGCCRGEEGFCCTDRGVRAPGVVFLFPQVRGVSEAGQGPAAPQARQDGGGKSGLCCEGKSGTGKRDTVGSEGLSHPWGRPCAVCLCLDPSFQRKSPDNTAPYFWHLRWLRRLEGARQ